MAGLEARYEVHKINDSEGRHDECRFFVLDPQHDPIAERTLSYYAAIADDAGYQDLAVDLREWLRGIREGRSEG